MHAHIVLVESGVGRCFAFSLADLSVMARSMDTAHHVQMGLHNSFNRRVSAPNRA